MFSVVSVVLFIISLIYLLIIYRNYVEIKKINKENELLRIQLKYREKIIDLLKKRY